jgi:hypothetical protein
MACPVGAGVLTLLLASPLRPLHGERREAVVSQPLSDDAHGNSNTAAADPTPSSGGRSDRGPSPRGVRDALLFADVHHIRRPAPG